VITLALAIAPAVTIAAISAMNLMSFGPLVFLEVPVETSRMP
jgi:hypothetical protein